MTDMDRCVYCNAPGCIAGTADHPNYREEWKP